MFPTLGLVSLVAFFPAQKLQSSGGHLGPTIGRTLSGTVLDRDGLAVPGAVVTTSAGGRAVTGAGGRFHLEVAVPLEAECLQVTAIGGPDGGNRASRTVAVALGASQVDVDVLRLTEETPCEPSWIPTFGGLPGVDGEVLCSAVFDDGSGPALYVGGSFSVVAGVPANHIARWDGASWSPLAGGLGADVLALEVFDDGGGPALYAGGRFLTADGLAARHVARWDGAGWSPVGAGISGIVRALKSFDDGSGPALYAGVPNVVRWSGGAWSSVGGGTNGTVHALTVFDVGAGPVLFAGGIFSTAGGTPASCVASWDGSSWSPLGAGVDSNREVFALKGFDDGSGPALYVGGDFREAGGLPARGIARWDGSAWSLVGQDLSGDGLITVVNALTVFDDGSGPALYAGGRIQRFLPTLRGVARWDGTAWSPLASGVRGSVLAFASFDTGSGPTLFVGGAFLIAGDMPVQGLALWASSSWSALGDGLNFPAHALAVFDDGTGSALYVGGEFDGTPDVVGPIIARWDGSGWSPLGLGISTTLGLERASVRALAVFDDGLGPKLIVGGRFSTAGGVLRRWIAAWDGASWSSLGTGTDEDVQALAVFDDGNGPALYAGGHFTTAGGLPASRIARWNGTSWSALGAGVDGPVSALAVFDDGTGPALYVGGDYASAGGISSRFARWNGQGWEDVGDVRRVLALAVHDDGHGPALFVGGSFVQAAGLPARGIVRWDGTTWSALGSGVGTGGSVRSLAVFDPGLGRVLVAGGRFTTVGGVSAGNVATWDGASWAPLGGGVGGGLAGQDVGVDALAVFDDGDGPSLVVAGSFPSAFDSEDSYLARWGGCLRLGFDVQDDFTTALANGQDIASPAEFGRFVSISSAGPNAGAAIFDSTPGGPNDPSQDLDLLVGRDHLLILQTDQNTTQTTPGIFDRPNDDSDGGTLRFHFERLVHPCSLTLVDIDSGANEATIVVQTDLVGRRRVHTVPPNWTGDILQGGFGHRTLDLTSLDPQPGYASVATAVEDAGFEPGAVRDLEVQLGGSGAVDDLHWGRGKALLKGAHRRRP